MRLPKLFNTLGTGLAALGLLFSTGCGGGSKANVITVTLSASPTSFPILGQSVTLAATVQGATNTMVNWTPPCLFTTTTTDSTGKVKTTDPATCTPDPNFPNDPNHTLFGVFSNQQATGTEVFTAPSNLPDQKTYPGLQIIVTAQSQQDTKRTGTLKLGISSGISVSFTPGTASLPVKEKQRFNALLTNDIGNTKGVTWTLTQNVPDSTFGSVPNPYTPLPTCSPACGTLNVPNASDPNTVIYTAPDTVPTAITPAQKNNTNSPANVTIVAVSNADQSCPSCVVIGTITITPGGPISFNGITPTIAPQGATLWDIYLDAPNLSSASTIFLTDSSGGTTHITSDSGQIKILFPIPTSSSSTSTTPAATCSSSTPCSSGARLRLNASNLTTPGPLTVSVSDPAQPCNTTNPPGTPCTASGTGTFTIVPVRPTSTATTPDDIVQGSQSQSFPVIVDGGYFGSFAPNPSAPGQTNFTSVYFQSLSNKTLSVDQSSTSSKLVTSLDSANITPANPGLYPLYVKSNAPAQPSPNNPSVTNMAIFPDYSTKAPAVVSALPGIPAGTNPSAVDIDESLGVMVVAEAGAPASGTTPAVPSGIQFYKIGQGSLAPIDQNGAPCTTGCPITSQTFPGVAINTPTGVSVNRTNHTVAIVNYGTQTTTTNSSNGSCTQSSSTGQSVTLLPIPGAPPPPPGTPAPTPFTVPLPYDPAAGQTLQGTAVCPAPMPYSIGVDPDSSLALVAYSSSPAAPTSAVNLGFIVNLNPNSGTNNYKCLLTDALTGQDPASSSAPVGQCLFAQVTLNTGTYPQIAVTPHGHSALVTPGGSGFVREVDVTKPSTANFITSASLAGGVVTVVVSTQCPPGVSATSSDTKNPCPLTMLPGSAGSVLITGLTANTASANTAFFNGVFTVNVTSSNSFSYAVSNTTATDSCKAAANTNPPVCQGEVFYGKPDQIFGLPGTSQGIAINPITNTAAIADTAATGLSGSQINLLSGLDQSPSSINFLPDCTAFTTTCSGGSPEFLPTADVAWQPFTNSLVSYNPNPHLNQVSISDPVTRKRYAFVCASSSACQVNPVMPSQIQLSGAGMATLPVQNGSASSTLTLFGGLAVDPVTNQAFVVKSGSGTIDIVDLTGGTAIKPTHISEVIVPSPPNSGQGTIGGIPNALVPQAALTCTVPVPPATSCDLSNVRILGSGFASGMTVRLDSTDITTIGGSVATPVNGGREVDVTIPASELKAPHHFALDILSNGFQSNAVDFIVVQQVDLSTVCTNSGAAVNTMPSSVAIADQIASGPLSPFALVSVTGCNDIVKIDLNPASATFGQQIGKPIQVGTNPEGIAIWQHRGLAVVANNGDGTASVIDLTQNPPAAPQLCASSNSSTTLVACAPVSTGTNPTGAAINEATGAAIVTNNGSNTVTMLNLAQLFPPSGTNPPTSVTPVSIGGIQQPIAVAIDPDRGINKQGIAVVTSVQIINGSAPQGALSVVEIGTATPALSTTSSSGFVSSIPTGIVFDPAVNIENTSSGITPGAFFANSSGTNAVTEFIPEGGGTSVGVGVNPTSLAINPQTGAMLTANSASNTISIVDTISSPFKTRQTLGIPGSPTFGVAIDQFTNLAVIVDQANMRVLLFPMPN